MVLLVLSCKANTQTDSLWNKEFACAQDIIDTYTAIKRLLVKKIRSCTFLTTVIIYGNVESICSIAEARMRI